MMISVGDRVEVDEYPDCYVEVLSTAGCDQHPHVDHEMFLVQHPWYSDEELWVCHYDLHFVG